MRCLFCKKNDTEVIETRVSDEGATIRRRRSCGQCQRRFTTYERIEELPILVVKRDGRRERFDRAKLRDGVLKAVGKTTVSLEHVEQIVSQVESQAVEQESAELSSQYIGEMVAKRLKEIDKVAYIRFSSVFRRFVDVEEFEKELKKLI